MEELTFEELVKAFQPVAARLKNEGNTVDRIADVFSTYVHAKVNNHKAKARDSVLRDADELGI